MLHIFIFSVLRLC